MTKTASKAIKAARLAVSAERIGSESEATQAARTAGELARRAGLSLDELDVAVGSFCASALSWSTAVDAWYDARVAV